MDEGQAAGRGDCRQDGDIVAVGDREIDRRPQGTRQPKLDRRRRQFRRARASSKRICICSAAPPMLDHLQLSGVHGFDALAQAVRAYAVRAAGREAAAGAGRRLHDPVGKRARHPPSSRPHHRRPALRHDGAGSSHHVGEHARRWSSPGCCTARRSGRATRSSWAPTGWPKANCARARRSGRCSILPAKAACGWAWRPAASPIPTRRRRSRRTTAPS